MIACSRRQHIDGESCSLAPEGTINDTFCCSCQSHWTDGVEPNNCLDNPRIIEICTEAPPEAIQSAKERFAKTGTATGTARRVSTAVYNQRLAVCQQCPYYTGHICKKCGCILLLKHWLEGERCPIELW